nr:hypothetical protein [Chloroflexaceae bacterium]
MTHSWRLPTAFVLLLATLALPGLLESRPLELLLTNGLQLRLDGLSRFFVLLVALAALLPAPSPAWRQGLAALLCALAFALTDVRLVALCYGLAALALWNRRQERPWLALGLALLPPLLLLVAAVQLGQLAGSTNYSLPVAASGLSSAVFAATLLATILGVSPLVADTSKREAQFVLQLAWCYPLLRLAGIGPWNWGWHVGLLTLALALLLHATWQALRQKAGTERVYLTLALTAVGTGTAVGMAAALVALLLALLTTWDSRGNQQNLPQRHKACPERSRRGTTASRMPIFHQPFAGFAPLREILNHSAPLLLTPMLPLTLPFVGLWLLL